MNSRAEGGGLMTRMMSSGDELEGEAERGCGDGEGEAERRRRARDDKLEMAVGDCESDGEVKGMSRAEAEPGRGGGEGELSDDGKLEMTSSEIADGDREHADDVVAVMVGRGRNCTDSEIDKIGLSELRDEPDRICTKYETDGTPSRGHRDDQ
ncbi:uncharacterized protein A4U43_C04F29110 [Asparagus officinalis]|uniref:DUF834 domain-containing protein n=1 Tax=Asparagus officinalis TaxID=4686 RepID=A0A5P1F508_ASPOF|nr:uncharacterized protein A4U43_C04F29110 [Asparagus officinalis]